MAKNGQSSNELTNNDLQMVLEAVYPISSDNVINFGLKLGLTRDNILTLEVQYHQNMKHCLTEILNQRLQPPLLTWSDIVQALETQTVGEHALARNIQSQYISPSSDCQVRYVPRH